MKFIIAWILLLSSSVWAYQPGDVFMESARNLRPTQATVGMIEVEKKAKKIEKFSDFEREQFLKARTVPVVVGPGNEFYIIDRHHLSRALLESGHHHLYLEIKADWSGMSPNDFWSNMEQKGYVYLFDREGEAITPSQLPHSLMGLKDDPYRSLAFFARKAGAFAKSLVPFAEFKWARYYRQFISKKEINKDLKKAVKKALIVSKYPQAAELPGFISASYRCNGIYHAVY